MKFIIEIEANTQPGLIESLNIAKQRLVLGGCYVNQCHSTGSVKMKPADTMSEDEFQQQFHDAHPKPKAKWVNK